MYGRTTCNQDTAIAILKLPLVTVTYCFFFKVFLFCFLFSFNIVQISSCKRCVSFIYFPIQKYFMIDYDFDLPIFQIFNVVICNFSRISP